MAMIEQHYQDAIDRLTPREKIARGITGSRGLAEVLGEKDSIDR